MQHPKEILASGELLANLTLRQAIKGSLLAPVRFCAIVLTVSFRVKLDPGNHNGLDMFRLPRRLAEL